MNRREIEKAKLKTKEWEDKIRRLAIRGIKKHQKVYHQKKKHKKNKSKIVIPKQVFHSYKEYINSDVWKAKRVGVLKRAEYKCERCGGRAWQVHHKTYKHLFHERPNELEALCGTCHQDNHNLLTGEQIEMKSEQLLIKNGFINY